MSRLRKHLPCLVIVGVYLVCILITDPRGDFPLNDDWSYMRSAFALGSGQGIKVDEWSAPTLVGQAFYGGLLTWIFSPGFLLLRISTLFLSCCAAVLLWLSLLRVGFRKDLSCVVLLAWIFNPLQFSLSFTYMTEIPFLFFTALAFYFFIVHLDSGKPTHLVLSAAALGYGYLIRQTALLFLFALACSLLLDSRETILNRLKRVLGVAGTAGAFIAGYYVWVLGHGRTTAAVQRKFELLGHLTGRQLTGNSFGMLFYLAFMLLPVWIFLFTPVFRMIRSSRRTMQAGIVGLWCLIVIAGLWWFRAQYTPSEYLPSAPYHSRMPFLLNVLYDSGLGPVTLEPTYFGPPSTPTYPWIWNGITGIVAAGAVLIGSAFVFGLVRLSRLMLARKRKLLIAFAGVSFLGLGTFEIVFSHLQEGGLFDRHILIVSFPLYLLLGILAGQDAGEARGRGGLRLLIPGIAVATLAVFCVAGTHDYLQWNRVRWEMGRSLLRQGIDPISIAGGFEFNAWNNYDVFAARGNIGRIHHWWYDRPDYVIAMSPQENYEILQSKSYYSWLHRLPVTLFTLRMKP